MYPQRPIKLECKSQMMKQCEVDPFYKQRSAGTSSRSCTVLYTVFEPNPTWCCRSTGATSSFETETLFVFLYYMDSAGWSLRAIQK